MYTLSLEFSLNRESLVVLISGKRCTIPPIYSIALCLPFHTLNVALFTISCKTLLFARPPPTILASRFTPLHSPGNIPHFDPVQEDRCHFPQAIPFPLKNLSLTTCRPFILAAYFFCLPKSTCEFIKEILLKEKINKP